MPAGPLYLLPVALGESQPEAVLPEDVRRIAASLRYFIAEKAKSARAELRRIGVAGPLRDLVIRELPREPGREDLAALLAPLLAGEAGGLMSEAGVPAVADPGARLVQAAHELGIRVVPLVGPSSLLLALMASGLDGQRFAFHGYLPVEAAQRKQRIGELERESLREGRTQIFIETPYRNMVLFAALLETCRPGTRLCVATELTTPQERIASRRIDAWRKLPAPALDRRPTVFLMLAG
ncbi:MAG TPA: SAM-dependent methyltransferase [Candidatus Desulfobacillus sp.]|nr:SAM-dependent methyltransferase [Candidatus Desulfobacillus sp.]